LTIPFVSVRDTFVSNPEFEGLSVGELIDASLTNWVHHIQYILPQVRAIKVVMTTGKTFCVIMITKILLL
jgi:hypothetical protein